MRLYRFDEGLASPGRQGGGPGARCCNYDGGANSRDRAVGAVREPPAPSSQGEASIVPPDGGPGWFANVSAAIDEFGLLRGIVEGNRRSAREGLAAQEHQCQIEGVCFVELAAVDVPGGPGGGARITLSEGKALVSMWSRGSFRTVAASIRYHAAKHGPGDVWTYLRQAANFNRRGAHAIFREDSIRYLRKSGEYLIERAGKILSYGRD